MNDDRKYVFVGNRGYVLFEMLRKKLNIQAIWVMDNSFLHKQLLKEGTLEFEVISSKTQLLQRINEVSFDILISNGCKYILPILDLKKATYINIHPSYLPDLKGKDPIKGAILLNRDSGATCHIMDQGIDTGEIISRVNIPMTMDIESAILFQLAFLAEIKVFRKAYDRNFTPLRVQPIDNKSIYYSSTKGYRNINLDKGFEYIIQQVKAYGYKSKGLYFKCCGKNYLFFRASEIINPFVIKLAEDFNDREVILSFEDSIVFNLNNRVMRFDGISNHNNEILISDYIENGEHI